jgi:hypothetical protein
MVFDKTIFVGVDLMSAKKFAYAALNAEMRLVALSEGSADDVLAFLAGQVSAFAAINAPFAPNKGMVKKLKLANADMRLADYELRQRGIAAAMTPSKAEQCSASAQSGFTLYKKLKGLGYAAFPLDEHPLQYMETSAQAIFASLLGENCLPKASLEGRLQRQLILFERRLKIKDPMDFFEELTRHKLMKGALPLDHVYSTHPLDAIAAAYTALIAATRPADVIAVGDPGEGQIILPVKELNAKY